MPSLPPLPPLPPLQGPLPALRPASLNIAAHPLLLQVGPAQLLWRPARPGLRGLLLDVLHLLLGVRSLPIMVAGVSMTLPPLSALVGQAGATALSYNAAGFCRTPVRGVRARHPAWLLAPATLAPATVMICRGHAWTRVH